MRPRLSSLVDLRQGEARPALRAFLLLTLLIGGHTLLETARDALFLSKLPPSRLAIVYALIAAMALVIAGPNARFARRFGEGRALLLTLGAAAGGTVLLYVQPPTPAVLFCIYVWSAFLSTVMVVQYWIFLATVFTPSQGKRLFGPIAAGGVTGAVAGASGAVAALTIVPVRSLLLGAAGAFVLAAFVSTTIDPGSMAAGPHRARDCAAQRPPALLEGAPPAEPLSDGWLGAAAHVRLHAYIGWLAALTALSTATVLATDYLFKADVARRVAPGDLGAYFARSYAVFNAVALVVQVFVAGPLVRRAGVARALLVVPVLLLGGATAALITGAPAAVLLMKGFDGALRHSLHRVTLELLGLPISAQLRARIKPAIEGVAVRAVQAIMAAVLFFLATKGHGSLREITALIAGLALAWLVAALAIRRPHLDMFRHAISKGALPGGAVELDGAMVRAVVEMLSSPDPARVIAAMDLLVDGRREGSIPGAVLRHASEDVKLHALARMAEAGRRDWAPEAERLLLAPASERVRIAAIRALAAVGRLDAIKRSLTDESPAVRAHAAVALGRAQRVADPMTMPVIQDILAAPGEAGRAAKLAVLDAIRVSGDRGFSSVVLAISDEADPEIAERAVLAMASVRDPRFIPTLVERLPIRATRAAVREALVDLGEPAQEALERAMGSEATPPALRLHIPRTLCRFGNQRAADFLTRQLALDPSRLIRYKVLRGLGRLVASTDVLVDRGAILAQMRRNLIEHLEMLAMWVPLDRHAATKESAGGRLVLGLLSDKLDQSLERAFRLLHIAYRDEDIHEVYVALSSPDRRTRSDAMEFLDALTADASGREEHETRELLKLVVDELASDEKVQRGVTHIPEPPRDHASALMMLVRDHDTSLAALAAYHALELGLDRVLAEVERAAWARPSLLEMVSAVLGWPAEGQEAPR